MNGTNGSQPWVMAVELPMPSWQISQACVIRNAIPGDPAKHSQRARTYQLPISRWGLAFPSLLDCNLIILQER